MTATYIPAQQKLFSKTFLGSGDFKTNISNIEFFYNHNNFYIGIVLVRMYTLQMNGDNLF